MRSRVLYFPYIEVPQTLWLTQMLLYWDAVCSIVPYDFVANPDALGSHMRRLVQEGLVQQVLPGDHIYGIPDLASRFESYIEQLGPELDDRRQDFNRGIDVRIHIEKMMHRTRQHLCDLHLAEPAEGPWYRVEFDTAQDFMSYLAVSLGRLDSVDASPVTDKSASLGRLARAGVPDDRIKQQLESLRIQVLDRVLPTPDRRLDPSDIRKFKDHHGRELEDFRRRVEQALVTAATIENDELRNRHMELFLDEAEANIKEISEQMRYAGWGVAKRGLSVVAAIPGAHQLVGLLSAVVGAATGGKRPQQAREFAYAAHAQYELR